MEEMQRKHERILGKTLNCYRTQMEELRSVIAQRQDQADDAHGQLAVARRRGREQELPRNQSRSSEAALRDALEVFSTYDPALPKQQSLEFRTERLVR